MIAATRNLALIINNFEVLSTLTDYLFNSESSMLGTVTVSDNKNPFAGVIKSGDRVRNSLFTKSKSYQRTF